MNKQLPTHNIPPAQLFVGNKHALIDAATAYLQNIFSCTQVQEHHAIVWLSTEKYYTLDQIAVINEKISFALDEGQQFFFVIEQADLLSTACANSLLKSVEEPPPGYHFLFLTERRDAVLPTIRSRCVIHTLPTTDTTQEMAPVLNFFKQSVTANPAAFLKEIGNKTLHEQATRQALDHLLAYWLQEYKQATVAQNKQQLTQAQRMVTVLKTAAHKPPMPGGSKLFWKNLLLQITP